MFNRERTKEVFGYDLDISKRRRTKAEIASAPEVDKKGQLMVVDNCPICNKERQIKLRSSNKNKPCSKCFHNTPEMHQIKLQQKGKQHTEIAKQKMKDNQWLKNGGISPFKGKQHTEESKELIAQKAREQNIKQKEEWGNEEYSITRSCSAQRIKREDFKGFTSSENLKIRQSPEGKAWIHDVLSKANFTCEKCNERGGSLTAHHKNAFASYPEDRFNIDNGACLCKECHSKFHIIFGKGSNTIEHFLDYLKMSKEEIEDIVSQED